MLLAQKGDTLICIIEADDIQEVIEKVEEAAIIIRNNIANGNIKEGIIRYNKKYTDDLEYGTKIREEVY